MATKLKSMPTNSSTRMSTVEYLLDEDLHTESNYNDWLR